MPKQEKIDAVAEYGRLFKESDSFFVTDYQGLSVADMNVLRKDLRANAVRFVVGKNTLFRLAARDAEVEGIEAHLNGPTAIAFAGSDPAAAAKILNESFKSKELPRMKAFWVENVSYEADQIGRLADLPTKEILYSQVVGAVEAPFSSLVRSLDAFFHELIGSVDALAKKKGEEG
ncbi:MAG: 50S ribosomal protein L10 [bacterium]